MASSKSATLVLSVLGLLSLSACAENKDNANTTATTEIAPPPIQKLRLVPEPQEIALQRSARGEEEHAQPVLRILSPANGSVVEGPTVQVRLELGGNLKGYEPHKDPTAGTGNHIHVILDDNPYEAYYDLGQPFELKNVTPGKHLLRVFPSRPWHESYKNDGAFQMSLFTVKDHATTATNTTNAVQLDPRKPLLTYSRPKGEYKGPDAQNIMIDFWLLNAKLKGDGGEYVVRYIIDDDEPRILDRWEPIWLSGWIPGKHTVRLELLGADQYPLKNGNFNITTREITVVK